MAPGDTEALALAERKLKGIEDISRALASEHHLDRILDVVMEKTTALMEAERATLYLLREDEPVLWSQVTTGGDVETITLPRGHGIAGWVAAHGRTVNVKDAYQDPRFEPSFDEKTGFRTASVLCVPLMDSQGVILGVIQVLNRREGYFTPEDEGLLRAIAAPAAISIHNSTLYLKLRGQNIDLREAKLRLEDQQEELELLYRVERAAAQETVLEEAIGAVLETTLSDWPCDVGAVVLFGDGDERQPTYAAVAGPAAQKLVGGPTYVGADLPLDQPVLTDDARGELSIQGPDLPPGWSVDRACIVPIQRHGELFGMFQLLNWPSSTVLDPDDLRVLGSIARRVAQSLVLDRAIQEEKNAERMASIGELLAAVLHDLKTPLTVIAGYARLMAREDVPTEREACRHQIRSQIQHMTEMTEELLSFARGETEVLLQRVMLSDFLQEVREILRREMEESGLTVEVGSSYQGACKLDPQKMRRVVYNLARNAREAMGEHGAFHVQVDAEDDSILFRFKDTGPGIPAEMEGRLFESFATHGKETGTGLGLAIVKKIVEEHRGTVHVESAAGQGTTFTISIPR